MLFGRPVTLGQLERSDCEGIVSDTIRLLLESSRTCKISDDTSVQFVHFVLVLRAWRSFVFHSLGIAPSLQVTVADVGPTRKWE